jgi:hypothetical protein
MQRHSPSQRGPWEPDDSEVARLILRAMSEPAKPSVPKPLSRLQREVAQDFADVRRQWARR